MEIDFKARIVATKQEKQLPALYAVYRSKVSVDLTAELNLKIKAKRADLSEG